MPPRPALRFVRLSAFFLWAASRQPHQFDQLLALGIQAPVLRPYLFEFVIKPIDGLCSLPQHQFKLGGVACFIGEVTAEPDVLGAQLINGVLQWGDVVSRPPSIVPVHAAPMLAEFS